MIQNPTIQGGGGAKKYKVTSDEYNKFYPEEATPGEYVVTVTGSLAGTPVIYTGPNATGYYIAEPIMYGTLDELPPDVRAVIEKYPATYAPPMATRGYLFFVMPPCDVFVETRN